MAANFSQVLQTEDWKSMCLAGGELVVVMTNAIGNIQSSKKRPLDSAWSIRHFRFMLVANEKYFLQFLSNNLSF